MDMKIAIQTLSALAQESRLEVFRLLVRQGAEGLPAGAVARALNVPHNTLSAHLSILSNAGLVQSKREGRSIIYSASLARLRELLAFLMEDCCQGRPEICGPLLDRILPECRPPRPS